MPLSQTTRLALLVAVTVTTPAVADRYDPDPARTVRYTETITLQPGERTLRRVDFSGRHPFRAALTIDRHAATLTHWDGCRATWRARGITLRVDACDRPQRVRVDARNTGRVAHRYRLVLVRYRLVIGG